MRQDYTDISIVLDRSGSMLPIAADTIGGFNKFLTDQKTLPGTATLTLAQFDNVYDIVHDGKPLQDIPALDSTTFVPRGTTALLDAIGHTINRTGNRLRDMAENDRPAKVIFVIITDGYENASCEFNAAKINEMIGHQRDKYKWEFVFLGANQDAITSAANIGIPAASSMTYASNSVGTQAAFGATSRSILKYRKGASASATFSDKDREEQKQAGA